MAAPYGAFAAMCEESPETLTALARLCPPDGALALIEAVEVATPPGMRVVERGLVDQMVAGGPIEPDDGRMAIEPLGDADATEMLALATLTRPGPFFERTHELGDFFGVRIDGRLAAMAGERMRIPGHTEVSGVCTHPDHRGKGYGAALTRRVASRIFARGETPVLHVFSGNAPAIAVYEALGFKRRTTQKMVVLAWDR
jgi:hypothetical protein